MCNNVCLLGFAGALFRKVTRASVIICVCVYWRGTASWLGRGLALRLRPDVNNWPNLSQLMSIQLPVRPPGHGLALLCGVVRRELAPPAQRRRHHLRALLSLGRQARHPVAPSRHRDRGVDQLGGGLRHYHRTTPTCYLC